MIKNKTILITGSTNGLGKSIGNILSINNNIIYNGRQDKIEKNYIKANLSTFKGLNNLLSKLPKKIDILILNIGINDRKSIFETTKTDLELVINTNTIIPLLLIQNLVNNQKLTKNCQILFIGSILGVTNDSKSIAYTFTKGALYNITKYLAQELTKNGIRVNLVNPGFFESNWHKDKTKKQLNKIINKIPLKRMAKTEEIAKFCINILENEYLTGSIHNVSGGYDLFNTSNSN